VALVAHETGIVVDLPHIVGEEIEPVPLLLPVRNKGGHVVVHGHVRITVNLAPDLRKVPPGPIVRVAELGEVQRSGRRHDEEVPLSIILVDVPIRRTREEQPVVPPSPDVIVLVGGPGMDEPDRAVGVDVEDCHVRVG